MVRKFALFDIDKTLVRGDSLFALYFYGARRWPVYWLWLPVIPFAGLLYALKLLPVERVKRIFYAPLRRFHDADFAEFFDRKILARSLAQPMERLRCAREEGYYILLVTASAACYMRPFVERGFADALLGTEVERDGAAIPAVFSDQTAAAKKKCGAYARFWNKTGCKSTMKQASATRIRTATYPCFGL